MVEEACSSLRRDKTWAVVAAVGVGGGDAGGHGHEDRIPLAAAAACAEDVAAPCRGIFQTYRTCQIFLDTAGRLCVGVGGPREARAHFHEKGGAGDDPGVLEAHKMKAAGAPETTTREGRKNGARADPGGPRRTVLCCSRSSRRNPAAPGRRTVYETHASRLMWSTIAEEKPAARRSRRQSRSLKAKLQEVPTIHQTLKTTALPGCGHPAPYHVFCDGHHVAVAQKHTRY